MGEGLGIRENSVRNSVFLLMLFSTADQDGRSRGCNRTYRQQCLGLDRPVAYHDRTLGRGTQMGSN
jgi:hypothetical protein